MTVTSVPPPNFGPTDARPVAPAGRPAETRNHRKAAWIAAVGVVGLAAAIAVLLLVGSTGPSPERAIAEAINLRAGDLPGFTVQPPDHSGTGQQIDARMKTCVGAGWIAEQNRGQLADVRSPQFATGSGLGAEEVSSSVTIKRTAGAVGTDFASLNSGRLQRCLAAAFDGVAIPTSNGVSVTIGNVRVRPLPLPSLGSAGSFGMRTIMTMSALGRGVPVAFDFLGYAVGKDELGLTTFTVGQTFSTAGEEQLSSLLISRALARPH